ncbi:TPA: hypothetical protein ACH3X3_007517 [Trebouxia sp. C0006]
MLEVFSEFYDGDKQDMHGQNVDNTRIDSSVPFNAKEFDLDFTGSAEQVELPNMVFGVSTDAYDLNELLEWIRFSFHALAAPLGAVKYPK